MSGSGISARKCDEYKMEAENGVRKMINFLSLIRQILPLVLSHCWLGSRKGIWPKKVWSDGVLALLSVGGEVQTCIWLSWCHCHSLSWFSKIPTGFTLLVSAHPDSPGQMALKYRYTSFERFFGGCECTERLLTPWPALWPDSRTCTQMHIRL